jgi:hypothetical protein
MSNRNTNNNSINNFLTSLANALPRLLEHAENQRNVRNILNQSLHEDTKRPYILNDDQFESWESYKYSDMSETFRSENTSCPITCEDYTDDTVIVKMPCGHYITEEAAKKWFSQNCVCPFCRTEFEKREMTDDEYEKYLEDNQPTEEENPSPVPARITRPTILFSYGTIPNNVNNGNLSDLILNTINFRSNPNNNIEQNNDIDEDLALQLAIQESISASLNNQQNNNETQEEAITENEEEDIGEPINISETQDTIIMSEDEDEDEDENEEDDVF